MSSTSFLDSHIISYIQAANSPTIMVTNAVAVAPFVSPRPVSVRYQLPQVLDTIDESVAWSLHEEEDEDSEDEDSSLWGRDFDPATLMVDERYVEEANIVFPEPQSMHPGDLTIALERYDSIAAAEEFSALTADLSFTLGLYGYLLSSDSCDSVKDLSYSFTSKDISALLASASFADSSLVPSESGYDASVSDMYDDDDDDTIKPSSPVLVPSLVFPTLPPVSDIPEYESSPIVRSSPAAITPTTVSISGIITSPTTPTSFTPEIRAEVAKSRKKKDNLLVTFFKTFCGRGVLARTNHGGK
jgi:hypothetical protein